MTHMNFDWVIVPKRTGDGSPPLIALKMPWIGPQPLKTKIPINVAIRVIRVEVMIGIFHL